MNTLDFQVTPPVWEGIDLREFALRFDHTDLKPTSGKNEFERLCGEAAENSFCSVCIAPRWVTTAVENLSALGASLVRVCTVVGFPHGNTTSESKVAETKQAIVNGASEIDMVISVGDLKDGNVDAVARDISAVVEATQSGGAILKVILETCYLDENEIIDGCRLAMQLGADFVKTSTGFGPTGADADVVRIMRQTVGESVGVKAAGGIRTLADAQRMLDAGASRLGCSSSVSIMEELKSELKQGSRS